MRPPSPGLRCPLGTCLLVSDQRPADIRDYTAVRDTPLALGIVLALLAVGTLAQVLVSSVRLRHRDLAILETLGLVRPQILLDRGLGGDRTGHGGPPRRAAARPAGRPLVLGAVRQLAGPARPTVIPVPMVLLAIPVTWLLAVIIAIGPGRSAAQAAPAALLRAE